MRFAALLMLSSCASLRTGWARVTWSGDRIAPVAVCSSRVDGEGDVLMSCVAMGEYDANVWWHREQKRAHGGEL